MKRNVLSFTVVEGDPNLITDNEIWYKKNPNTGFIDLQMRNSEGELKSFVQNNSLLANPELPITTFQESQEFREAFAELKRMASVQGTEVSKIAYMPYVEIINKYIPSYGEIGIKMPNIIGLAGSANADGGFTISDGDEVFKAVVNEDSIILANKIY